MPEWLVEHGIGENRAILVDRDRVLAARVEWPEELRAGEIAEVRLISRRAGSSRGTVRFDTGEEALVDALPATVSEGGRLRVVVTRAAVAEKGRYKLAQARPTQLPVAPSPSLAKALAADGSPVRIVRRFADDPWPEIVAEAVDGVVSFPGGSLIITPAPAMTLIDIDGALPATALCQAAVPAITAALGRMDIAGSIGIDFPTLEGKDDRRAVDRALSTALDHWPHERTAMNGFGFVQLIARLERPSLLQRMQHASAASAARLLLRQAENVTDPGAILLTANPAVRAATQADWVDELRRRTGRTIRWTEDRKLALLGGFAQAVPL